MTSMMHLYRGAEVGYHKLRCGQYYGGNRTQLVNQMNSHTVRVGYQLIKRCKNAHDQIRRVPMR